MLCCTWILELFVLNLLFYFWVDYYFITLRQVFHFYCSLVIYIFVWPYNSSWSSSLTAPLLVEYYSSICSFPLVNGYFLVSYLKFLPSANLGFFFIFWLQRWKSEEWPLPNIFDGWPWMGSNISHCWIQKGIV